MEPQKKSGRSPDGPSDDGRRGRIIEIHPDWMARAMRLLAVKLKEMGEDDPDEKPEGGLPCSVRRLARLMSVDRNHVERFFLQGKTTDLMAEKLAAFVTMPHPLMPITGQAERHLVLGFRELVRLGKAAALPAVADLIQRGKLEDERTESDRSLAKHLLKKRSDPSDTQ